MKKVLFFLVLGLFAGASIVSAQPRKVESKPTLAQVDRPAPSSFTAKYEGGMAGYNRREEGTLKFDDENSRLVFYGKDQKEWFGIPYSSMLIVTPQSERVQSTTGKVVSVIPYGSLIGGFIKERRRYLVIHFADPDVDATGLTNFRIDDQILLDAVIAALGYKAELKQRGEGYIRPKVVKVEGEN